MDSVLLQDRVITAMLALLANMAFLGWPILLQLLGIDALLNWLKRKMGVIERKFNRPNRNASTRAVRGFLYVFFWLGLLYGLSVLYAMATESFSAKSHFYLEFLLLAWLLPVAHIWVRTYGVYHAVVKGNHGRASELARHFWRRSGMPQDEHGLLREAIEYLAIGSSRMVVAPLLGYLVGGLFGMITVHMIALMDEHVGYRSKQYGAFGVWTARLHTLVQFIPARLTGLLLFLSSFFVPQANPYRALACLARERGNVKSINNGWPLAVYAGALFVSVGGPRPIVDTIVHDRWVGPGSAKVKPAAVRRGLYMFGLSVFLLLLCLLGGYFLLGDLSGL